ncbi:MAG: hypothetical protein ABSC94_27715 [Polyangiaceae bacterium]
MRPAPVRLSPSPPFAKWSKACGVCRRTYGSAQWRDLTHVAMLPLARVQEHLSVPAAWTVELRQCVCGAVLATRGPG